MGRPVTIDDRKLLAAAREVFLKKGGQATTAEVARRAGISQASIFKRFGTKQGLFLAAMRTERDRSGIFEKLRARTEAVGLREALYEVGLDMIALVDRILPLILTAWASRGTFGSAPWASGKRAPFFADADQVVALIRREMDAGRLRRGDPWLVFRVYFATLQHHALAAAMFKTQPGPQMDATAYLRGVVDLLWAGIGPTSETKP